ncbi:MAG TPA: CpsD/CapB family tyrosine-protein kinase [Terriglobales bacterium]|jgi:capsular exopolysaccharide synthesis family protein|nr:CpsD/CapB family tyrosine-protein kinase [Terriglobales bacterium]
MSKFFNETRKAVQQQPNNGGPRPAGQEIDIQELVGAVKDGIDRRQAGPVAAEAKLKPLLAGTATADEVASQLAAGRMQQCRVVRLPRNDEKSFLATQYNQDLQAAVEAYRTLRTRLLKAQAKTGARSLALSSTAQGEGKTLTALNLGVCLSHLRRSVLIVDGDLRTKGLSRMLGLQQFTGLGDILESGLSYQSAILRTDFPDLYVLPAGTSATPPAELFSRTAWKDFVAWSGETFQTMVIDAPPVLDLADTELILAACESILLVVRSERTKRQALAKMLGQVDAKKLAGVVFNACDEAAAKNYYRYSREP